MEGWKYRSRELLKAIFLSPKKHNHLNPQVRINKMVNKHTVDYHPSPLELTSKIHTLIFLLTCKWFVSPEYFLNFFSSLFIPPWLLKSFNFIVLKLLENTFVSQKIESVHFYSCHQTKLTPRYLPSPLQAEGNYLFHPTNVFWKSIFPQQKGGEENCRAEKMIKIKLTRVWVTRFDKFHHFCNLFGFCFVKDL